MHLPLRRCFRCGWPPRAVRAWGYPHPSGVRILVEKGSKGILPPWVPFSEPLSFRRLLAAEIPTQWILDLYTPDFHHRKPQRRKIQGLSDSPESVPSGHPHPRR